MKGTLKKYLSTIGLFFLIGCTHYTDITIKNGLKTISIKSVSYKDYNLGSSIWPGGSQTSSWQNDIDEDIFNTQGPLIVHFKGPIGEIESATIDSFTFKKDHDTTITIHEDMEFVNSFKD